MGVKQPVLILLRHGQSLWNLENRFTGWKDIDLTETGKLEASHAAVLLENEHIDVAFTSSLKRALHTLDIVLAALSLENIPVYQSNKLNESAKGPVYRLISISAHQFAFCNLGNTTLFSQVNNRLS